MGKVLAAANAALMLATGPRRVVICTGIAAEILSVFLQCLTNRDNADTIRTGAFLLSYVYHIVSPSNSVSVSK